MGPTGVGKSTFISKCTEGEKIAIGHGMQSCTREVAPYQAQFPDGCKDLWKRRLILVDTPGFDDSRAEDVNILHKVSDWLAQMKHPSLGSSTSHIADITQKRMTGTSKLSLSMFSKLCGQSSFNKIRMVTSHWQDLATHKEGESREHELKANWWKDIMEGGGALRRIKRSGAGDELLIVQDLIKGYIELEKGPKMKPLKIQQEVVDLERSVPATEAGRELRYDLKVMLRAKTDALRTVLDPVEKKKLEEEKGAIESQIKELKLTSTERMKVLLRL
ncbi:hypothetical protein BKA70DRAFT_1500183 [Coprinopsis sp. MPI-PUGE-AT-0042]|nr:hypothetical protein BKA70DRAFT_1500183 [Coprinopsis sp. MPI-PUGE-AT-0042]